MSALLAVALSAVAFSAPSPEEAEPERPLAHHVARKAVVRAYDPARNRLVVFVGRTELVLHTSGAAVFGRLRPGRTVDVSWEHETREATTILVRPDRLRATLRP